LAAEWLAGVVRSVKAVTNGAKERIREEVGPEFDQVEWKKLDPRQFDPRRIMAEALRDADPIAGVERTPTSGSADVARDDASSQPRGVR
jgi:sec-independent protein translocase protein TatB